MSSVSFPFFSLFWTGQLLFLNIMEFANLLYCIDHLSKWAVQNPLPSQESLYHR